MVKDWRCVLGWHRFVKRHDPAPETPSAFYNECVRCGKFRDVPWRPPAGMPS